MSQAKKTSPAFALLAGMLASGAIAADTLQPYAHKGQVIQRLKAFDNPEGSIFSADGKWAFISNSAELGLPDKGFHFTRNAGYISKLAVQADGTLRMENEKLLTGLTAPLGMAVLPVATQKFPKGTIFLIEAAAPIAEADGTEIKDPKMLDPKIIAFDGEGKVLGTIAEGKPAPLQYIPVPEGGPDGVEVASDGTIHINTVGLVAGLKDPAEGGMYRLSREDFKSGRLPAPFARGLGALDGLDFVGSVRLDTEIKNTNSVTVTTSSGKTANAGIRSGGQARRPCGYRGSQTQRWQLPFAYTRTVGHVAQRA